VLAEAFHLLGKVPGAPEKLRRLLESGALRITFGLASQLPAVFALQRRYANLPMSLADACLVRMVEMHDGAEVFTVDSDFRIYRKSNRQVIPLIFPDEE
jgi:predicted nucleic acid-binding protein